MRTTSSGGPSRRSRSASRRAISSSVARWDRRRRQAPGRRPRPARRSARGCRRGRRCGRSAGPRRARAPSWRRSASRSAASAARLRPAGLRLGLSRQLARWSAPCPRRRGRRAPPSRTKSIGARGAPATPGDLRRRPSSSSRQLVLAAPAVEAEAQRHAALRRVGEDRPGVAQPDVAVRAGTSSAASPTAARAECSASPPLTSRRTRLPVPASARTSAGDVAARGLEVAVPQVGVGGPGRPDRLVRRPFGGDGDVICRHAMSSRSSIGGGKSERLRHTGGC